MLSLTSHFVLLDPLERLLLARTTVQEAEARVIQEYLRRSPFRDQRSQL